jgi:hypothetical protein
MTLRGGKNPPFSAAKRRRSCLFRGLQRIEVKKIHLALSRAFAAKARVSLGRSLVAGLITVSLPTPVRERAIAQKTIGLVLIIPKTWPTNKEMSDFLNVGYGPYRVVCWRGPSSRYRCKSLRADACVAHGIIRMSGRGGRTESTERSVR